MWTAGGKVQEEDSPREAGQWPTEINGRSQAEDQGRVPRVSTRGLITHPVTCMEMSAGGGAAGPWHLGCLPSQTQFVLWLINHPSLLLPSPAPWCQTLHALYLQGHLRLQFPSSLRSPLINSLQISQSFFPNLP